MDGGSDEAAVVEVSDVVSQLAADVASYDDNDDWVSEGVNKLDMIAKLRSLPTLAHCTHACDIVVLRFTSGLVAESIDLTVGVAVGLLDEGAIAVLEFDSSVAAAAKRISGLEARKQHVPLHVKPDPAAAPVSAEDQHSLDEVFDDDAGVVDVSALMSTLIMDIEERDDEDSWEEEDLDKQMVLLHLRKLPATAHCYRRGRIVSLRFSKTGSTMTIDLSVGVTAELRSDGVINSVCIDLDSPPAIQRLSAVPLLLSKTNCMC